MSGWKRFILRVIARRYVLLVVRPRIHTFNTDLITHGVQNCNKPVSKVDGGRYLLVGSQGGQGHVSRHRIDGVGFRASSRIHQAH